MKKKGVVAIFLVMVVLLLSSCFSFFGGGSDPFGFQKSVSDRASAEVASATGLTGMTRKMMFSVVYTQVFFIGGFGANFYELEETQGSIWRIESRDEDGNINAVEAERALLKRLPNGDQWWYLAWRAEGEAIEFEALMSKDQYAKKIRYYNADVKRVEEAVFDEPDTSNKDSETAPPPEPAVNEMDVKELSRLVKGKETIKIGSGTYNTERLEWSIVNEEDKATYTYTWWVDTKTAGGLVKYLWTRSGSKESLSGELFSLKKGYKTKFNSF